MASKKDKAKGKSSDKGRTDSASMRERDRQSAAFLGEEGETEARKSAEQVDQLIDRAPTTEQSSRENAGWTRRPDDGRPPTDIGVSDTIHGIPVEQRDQHPYDPSHRGKLEIQGDDQKPTGDEKERRNEETHL